MDPDRIASHWKRIMPDEEQAFREWYDRKSALMEDILGKEHPTVWHAFTPYATGGLLDLYYYADGVPGTGIATKELSESPDGGSGNEVFDLFELVMFTRLPIALDDAKNPDTPFGRAHCAINVILNLIARYSAQAVLNPFETCEFPEGMDTVGGKCLVFDAYGAASLSKPRFGLLLVLDVFRSEMEFARERGGGLLIEKLKERGVYPYSDLDREPVV